MYSDQHAVNALKLLQFMNSTGIFVIPALGFAFLVSDNFKKYLSLDKNPGAVYCILTILIMISALPLINYMVAVNENMTLPEFMGGVENWMRDKEDSAKYITESFMVMDTVWSFLANFLIIGIVPAFGEEFLFRGIIQKQLQNRMNAHAAIWITAILFSAMHLQFFGFIPRMLLGALFGYLFLWSGNLWVPIIAHLVNNGGAVTMQYLYGQQFMEEEVDQIGLQGDWHYLGMSLVLLTALLWTMKNSRK